MPSMYVKPSTDNRLYAIECTAHGFMTEQFDMATTNGLQSAIGSFMEHVISMGTPHSEQHDSIGPVACTPRVRVYGA